MHFIAPPKDPSAVLDYGMDWRDWLDDNEIITAEPIVSVTPAGLGVSNVSQNDGTVKWRLSGGTNGVSYVVSCQIVTSTGRVDRRSIRIMVRQR